MANPTTNLSMTKPTVGGSTDTWGTTINEEVVDVVDAVFGSGGTNVSMADVSVDQLTVIAQGDLRLADTTGGQYIAFQAHGTTTSYTLTMPDGVGASGQALRASDGAGALEWYTPADVGDITSVVAGAGMTGGGSSGAVTLNVIGTADKITVSADAVTIASTYVGQTSITTLGTIATGTWEGTTVAVNQGGTGATSLTDGGVLLGSGTGAITATAVLGDGEILIGDASGDPVALDVGSSTAITILGTVATGVWNGTAVGVAYGGTAISSYAAGDIIYASGSTTLAKLAKGSDTEVLTLASGVPTWAAPTVGDITGVTAGTGLSGGGTTGTVTLNVEASQTQITSVGALGAGSISSGFGNIDVGSSSIDGGTITGTFAGNITGNVTGNASGTAATVTGAAQSAITSVGTLTSLTTSGDVTLPATGKLYLDGGSNTYINEPGADQIDFFTGGGERLKITDTQFQIGTDAHVAGDLVATGTGPHAIGGAVNPTARLSLIGSWASSGLYSEMIGTQHSGILTAAAGDTDFQVGSKFGNNIVCQSESETVAVVAQAYFQEPGITQGGTALPITATVYIKDAPTEGTESAALYVASGDTVLKGNLAVGTTLRSDLHGAWSHIFLGEKGSLYSDNDTGAGGIDGMFLTDNLYLDSDTGSFAYIETNQASYIKQEAGALTFANAASGTGGAAATLTTRLTVSVDGLVLVNETANSDMTQGITINQGAADDEILCFKSSDVNQPSTNYAEADTYGFVSKAAADYGGLRFGAFTDTGTDGQTFLVYAVNADAANITKSTSGEGLVQFDAAVNSGTGSAVVGTDGNMVAFTNNGNAKFLFAAEGTGHADDSWVAFSDSRLKTNVEASPYGLTQVRDIEAKIFDKWSGEIVNGAVVLEEGSDRRAVGFIAQEIMAEMPELVKALPDDESFYSMDYGRMTPILWSAVKQLDATVQSLEARIVALEA